MRIKPKLLISCLLAGLLIAGAVWVWSASGGKESPIVGQLLRFHVLANSDSEADQQLKYKVRDAVLEYLAVKMKEVTSRQEAEVIIADSLPDIERIAAAQIQAAGRSYQVAAQLGQFGFPTRSYGQLTLPAGEYTALRVVIGRGEGTNWWCVLFPPLCFVNISSNLVAEPAWELPAAQPVFAPEQQPDLPEEVPQVRLKVWEFMKNHSR